MQISFLSLLNVTLFSNKWILLKIIKLASHSRTSKFSAKFVSTFSTWLVTKSFHWFCHNTESTLIPYTLHNITPCSKTFQGSFHANSFWINKHIFCEYRVFLVIFQVITSNSGLYINAWNTIHLQHLNNRPNFLQSSLAVKFLPVELIQCYFNKPGHNFVRIYTIVMHLHIVMGGCSICLTENLIPLEL